MTRGLRGAVAGLLLAGPLSGCATDPATTDPGAPAQPSTATVPTVPTARSAADEWRSGYGQERRAWLTAYARFVKDLSTGSVRLPALHEHGGLLSTATTAWAAALGRMPAPPTPPVPRNFSGALSAALTEASAAAASAVSCVASDCAPVVLRLAATGGRVLQLASLSELDPSAGAAVPPQRGLLTTDDAVLLGPVGPATVEGPSTARAAGTLCQPEFDNLDEQRLPGAGEASVRIRVAETVVIQQEVTRFASVDLATQYFNALSVRAIMCPARSLTSGSATGSLPATWKKEEAPQSHGPSVAWRMSAQAGATPVHVLGLGVRVADTVSVLSISGPAEPASEAGSALLRRATERLGRTAPPDRTTPS